MIKKVPYFKNGSYSILSYFLGTFQNQEEINIVKNSYFLVFQVLDYKFYPVKKLKF